MTKEEIGRVIKESRIAAGLTQLQVGEALNRPQTTIAAWEAGRSQPDANTLFELFQVLGRSVDEAFGFSKKPVDVTRAEWAYIQKYRCLDAYDKQSVNAVLSMGFKRFIDNTRPIEIRVLTETIDVNGGVYVSKNSFKSAIVVDNEYTRRAFLGIPVSGICAEYGIYDGDILLVSEEQLPPGGIGIFTSSNGEGYYHILRLDGNDYKSLGSNGTPIKVPLQCAGRVIGRLEPSWIIVDDVEIV